MDYKEIARRWLFAIGATIVYVAASGVGIFLWAFFLLPLHTGRIGTPEEFSAWWFWIYWSTLLVTVGYTAWCEKSFDPSQRKDPLMYVIILVLPFMLWAGRDDLLDTVFVFFLAAILTFALYDARTSHQKMTDLCQHSNCLG